MFSTILKLGFLCLVLGLWTGGAALAAVDRRDREDRYYEKMRAAIDASDKENVPLFVFLPGIMGTKLLAPDGEVLWGELSTKKELLQLDERETPLKTDTLLHFGEFILKTSIYEEVLRGRINSAFHDLFEIEPFNYDWRRDNALSAADFDLWLRKFIGDDRRRGRPLVIVAHSMGGLVLRYWYNNYYSADPSKYDGVAIQDILFVATPHLGSPQTTYRLVNKTPFDGIQKAVSLFGDVEAAIREVGFSFSSIYQLLPFGADCLIRVRTGDRAPCSPEYLYAADAWLQTNVFKDEVDRLGRDAFRLILQKKLKAARDFHSRIGPCDLPEARFFYSESEETRQSITYLADARLFDLRPTPKAGDGTVPRFSALCGANKPLSKGAAAFAGSHMEGPNTDSVRAQLGIRFADGVNRQMIAIMKENDELKQAYVDGNLYLPELLIQDERFRKSVEELNAVVARGSPDDLGVALAPDDGPLTELAKLHLVAKYARDPERAASAALEFSAQINSGLSNIRTATAFPSTLVRLAVQDDQYLVAEALKVSDRVLGMAGAEGLQTSRPALVASLYNTRGAIAQKQALPLVDRYREAEGNFLIAEQLGNPLAPTNLRVLGDRLRAHREGGFNFTDIDPIEGERNVLFLNNLDPLRQYGWQPGMTLGGNLSNIQQSAPLQ